MYVQMLDKSDFFFDIFEIFENITLLSNPEHNSSLRQQNSFSLFPQTRVIVRTSPARSQAASSSTCVLPHQLPLS